MNRRPCVADILKIIEGIAPAFLAASWDNIGLLVGGFDCEVTAIQLGLDPSVDLLEEAAENGANLLVTHHPVIFHPIKTLCTDQPLGRILAAALSRGVNIVACHTNIDAAPEGVSDRIAAMIGLYGLTRLEAVAGLEDAGYGRVGDLPQVLGGQEFLERLAQVLEDGLLLVAGPVPDRVRRVAVCGGSGDSLAGAARMAGADLYISGELKHATARWAEAVAFCIVDAGHFATEIPVVSWLASRLDEKLRQEGWSVPVHASRRERNPFRPFHPSPVRRGDGTASTQRGEKIAT